MFLECWFVILSCRFFFTSQGVGMKIFVFSMSLCFFCSALISHRLSAQPLSLGEGNRASLPPRGWNSYDSYSWIISEEQFLDNAEIVSQRLSSFGYEYVVVDYLWYRRKVKGAYSDSLGFDVIDEWGRMAPDPDRWPSSRGGKGFTKVANKVHKMGLKFGIHVMRGISTQAVNATTPILDVTTGKAYEENGTTWFANDIGIQEQACAWMPHGFMSVDIKFGAAKAFLRSLYQQYADWGVDFVKHDCVFGDDFDLDEISYVSDFLKQLDHEIIYSISPGTSVTPEMARSVNQLVNMYRITGDDWDSWEDVAAHFDISRDLSSANLTGATGLLGKSWPDLDMLPLGWLSDPGSNNGPHRSSNLSRDEQRTQMTLWAMAKSPLMFGGDLTKLDDATFYFITNPTILEINAHSTNNSEFPNISSSKVLMGREGIHGSQSGKSLSNLRTTVSLAPCSDPKAFGWFFRVRKRARKVCWKRKNSTPFCLYKKGSSKSNEEKVRGIQDQSQLILSDNSREELCLDASPKQRLRSEELMRASLSPCNGRMNQMWDLNPNGTLVNNYSGQCATINPTRARDVSNGVRSWIAMGRTGVIYLAFFNLDVEKTTISANVSDLGTAIRVERDLTSCKCREVWTGHDFGAITGSVSMDVNGHGCALFVLLCS